MASLVHQGLVGTVELAGRDITALRWLGVWNERGRSPANGHIVQGALAKDHGVMGQTWAIAEPAASSQPPASRVVRARRRAGFDIGTLLNGRWMEDAWRQCRNAAMRSPMHCVLH